MKGQSGRGKEPFNTVGQPRLHAPTGLYIRAGDGLRLRNRRVRRLVEKMRNSMHWLEPGDIPAARAWAELEILGANVFAELAANGITNTQDEPRRLLTELRQLRQVQLAYARELGMTPAARMAIKANRTRAVVDLAAAMASVAGHNSDPSELDESADIAHRAARNPSKKIGEEEDVDSPTRRLETGPCRVYS